MTMSQVRMLVLAILATLLSATPTKAEFRAAPKVAFCECSEVTVEGEGVAAGERPGVLGRWERLAVWTLREYIKGTFSPVLGYF